MKLCEWCDTSDGTGKLEGKPRSIRRYVLAPFVKVTIYVCDECWFQYKRDEYGRAVAEGATL